MFEVCFHEASGKMFLTDLVLNESKDTDNEEFIPNGNDGSKKDFSLWLETRISPGASPEHSQNNTRPPSSLLSGPCGKQCSTSAGKRSAQRS
jgi:hypothetical protein